MYAQILNQAIFEFNIHVVHRNSKMKQASEFHLLPIFQFNTTVNNWNRFTGESEWQTWWAILIYVRENS